MGLAFLFPGQGSQAVGMGTELAATCDECRAMFQAADSALGYSLSRIMAQGPAEILHRTAVTQPAVLALSVAQARHLMSLGVVPDMLAGHSLGQSSALVVAGAIDFQSAVRLVAERGRLMQEAVPEGIGSMVAVMGLERKQIHEACQFARSHGVVTVAGHNAPRLTVISGNREAVEAAADWCEDQGGFAIPLAVSAPSHCELMAPMLPEFKKVLHDTEIRDPRLPVIDNVSAQPLPDAASVRQSLIEQNVAPVLFEENLRYLIDQGISRVIECGPGDGLLALVKRINRQVERIPFERAVQDAVAARPSSTDMGKGSINDKR
jgi:[acyl-carrier-protein] S-malonyltransferase